MRHSPPNDGGFPSQEPMLLDKSPPDAPVLICSPLTGLAPDTLPKSELTDELNRISHFHFLLPSCPRRRRVPLI